MNPKSLTLKIKFAGGAAAQALALMNAIYLRNKLLRPFKLFYYPHSTGTYWPLGIKFLLDAEELGDEVLIRGLTVTENLEVGKIIQTHPLKIKLFSYERLLSIVRKLKLDRFLLSIRGEAALQASQKNLDKVSRNTQSVSGGFVPILDANVNREMDQRFSRSNVKSPFSLSQSSDTRPEVVIHYRIGDKRAKFTHPSDFGGDGIMNPMTFHKILISLKIETLSNIIVVSDEPKVAQSLLQVVGIPANKNKILGDIWEDLYTMSQAKIFIGSWSQVSQLASICVLSNGGKAFLPSTTQVGTRIRWNLKDLEYFSPNYFERDHWIYRNDFNLEDDSHKSYRFLT